jgi:hypothetical protein
VRDVVPGVRGPVPVTGEDGPPAAWRSDVRRPVVAQVVVCAPRKTTSRLAGPNGERVAAPKRAQLRRADLGTPVDHGPQGTRARKERARRSTAPLEDCPQ